MAGIMPGPRPRRHPRQGAVFNLSGLAPGTRTAFRRFYGAGARGETTMRMSMLAILVSVGAGSLMALPALAVQDQPTTQNGVETVCTGVGSAKDNPAWSGYPVKLTFSNMSGENEAMEHVSITQGGKAVLETDCY